MKYKVFLTKDAEDDIFEIYQYIFKNDSENKANYVFNKIKETCLSLISYTVHGHNPPELKRIDVFNYKEIHFKPYRIIYRIDSDKIYVYLIADGRRDMQTLLQRRILGAEGL